MSGFIIGFVAASLIFCLPWWSERQRANDLAARITDFEKALKGLQAAVTRDWRR